MYIFCYDFAEQRNISKQICATFYILDLLSMSLSFPLMLLLSTESFLQLPGWTSTVLFLINSNKIDPKEIQFIFREIPLRFMLIMIWYLRYLYSMVIWILSLCFTLSSAHTWQIWGVYIHILLAEQSRMGPMFPS